MNKIERLAKVFKKGPLKPEGFGATVKNNEIKDIMTVIKSLKNR